MRDFSDDLKELRRRVDEAHGYLKIDAVRAQLAELEIEVQRPDLWDDQDRAKHVNSAYARVRGDITVYDGLQQRLDDAEVLHEMAREEDDDSQEPDIQAAIEELSSELDELELRSLFTGPHDEADAICSINAKDGGVDAQDWAELLLRMYTRWAERRGFEVEVDDVSEGTEAGILSAEFTIKGRYAFGLMTAERGVHRLVRISPFDSQARRQTSFAAVEVYPALDEAADVPIDEKELRVDTYRSSGAGGQHVNKTSSAIRITHLPTGIVVTCQDERSQLQNRAKAMFKLQAILAARAEEEREAELQKIAGGRQAQVGWGSQIRSYVLQPYQMVKDLRTEHESGNVMGVLDGDIDGFMEAYLRWRRRNAEEINA
ncbi:MAG TPA: peptide chain release factor 2 [Acidimicrobiales bacterium]